MVIKFFNEGVDLTLKSKRKISSWVKGAVQNEGYHIGDINFIFCSPHYHLQINRQYLGHDYNTDVITFDTSTSVGKVSGDIFIDPRTVEENSTLYNTTFLCELYRVMIHGVLHLCGYDDHTEEQSLLIRTKEDHYLGLLAAIMDTERFGC